MKMKSANKTKKELMDEMESLQERVSKLEKRERVSMQFLGTFGERTDLSFSQMSHMHEAIFVVFDRKLEFINDRFTELFGVSLEEACNSNFDPMTLIAPESQRFIWEQYKEGCRGDFATKQFTFTGTSKNGLNIECETFLLFIPYKWGIAINGTLCSRSVQRHSDLGGVLNAAPTIFSPDPVACYEWRDADRNL
jgi:PAS domain-containing protein